MHTTQEVKAVFSDAEWTEQAYAEADGVKLTRARYVCRYRGDVAGRSVVESLMAYRTDGSVTFVGLERFEGQVLGRTGSFVVRHEGEYRDGVAESRGQLVPGTGTGALAAVSGESHYRARHGPENPVSFRLAFS